MAANKINNDMQKAKNSINKLFGYIGIKRVVCIDDQYDRTPSFDKFKSLCLNLGDDNLPIPELRAILSEDPDFFEINLEKFWKKLSGKEQRKIYEQIHTQSNKE